MTSTEPPKLVVHYLDDSRSQRILWLAEELGFPYEIKHWKRTPDRLAPKELASVHPLGTAPIIVDGDITVAESGAIIDYIIRKYGQGKVSEPASVLDDVFYTHYSEGTLMPLLVNKLIFGIVPSRAPWIVRPLLRYVFNSLTDLLVTPRLKVQAQLLEDHLVKGGEYLAGGQGPTFADYMMIFPLEAWDHGDPDALGPKTKEYIERIHRRPAYQRALSKGGEYEFAKPLPEPTAGSS
ncbi:thioredoxin-like protein [Irpex rosettiformis]|uniref:Thioredoxin-like protein n=1 Tax=Irpex rosettiformis TaxID=378272 RepID=A0ACB8U6B0_9APHY|nr:thioredoxin-like protein [Irpex rosettiformis]